MQADLTPLAHPFKRSLMARKRSPKTIKAYVDATQLFIEHQTDSGRPLLAAKVTRGDVEDGTVA